MRVVTGNFTLAAFKVQHSSERLYRAFLQERDVLLHATHPNIVELLGYSDDGDQGVLVFEYVSNGTLHEKLHCNGGHMVGSPGYADPHYLRTGIISKKSDVYSFGVLILEMVTGIAAVGLDDEKMLTVVMRERGWDRLEEIVDPTLRTSFDAGELEVLGDIAGRCVGDRPGLRPSMGEILRIMRERVKL
ncbi:probable receptor-like protein kinase At4g10390 [Asparagus officinalis]|uniref:probable receptor-like protein kinase At4g10390 n=1 Tax=Asparagus officinalis TaxID=4686 RepID=UPI00098E6D65|nr:probable receptor-like protein kinase At4g10390 [Asparagus officinalis]